MVSFIYSDEIKQVSFHAAAGCTKILVISEMYWYDIQGMGLN